jgi:hypothetical protein
MELWHIGKGELIKIKRQYWSLEKDETWSNYWDMAGRYWMSHQYHLGCYFWWRGRRNEMTTRGYATTSWHDKTTRGQRNERMRRGNVTTSWHDKLTRGRHNERTTNNKRLCNNQLAALQGDERVVWRNLVVFRVQTESTGQVTTMVVALVSSVNQNDCALEMNFKKSAMWSKRASELEDISRISEPN